MQNQQVDPRIQGYIAELREQNTGLSDRAGQLAAALTAEKQAHAETAEKLRALEEANAEAAASTKTK